MFVPILVDLMVSVLTMWTNQVMTEWLTEMAESKDKENRSLHDSEVIYNGSNGRHGDRRYRSTLTTSGVYYHLYSESDPICYSLSDLEDMEEDIISELREISLSEEELEDSVFLSEEDNVI